MNSCFARQRLRSLGKEAPEGRGGAVAPNEDDVGVNRGSAADEDGDNGWSRKGFRSTPPQSKPHIYQRALGAYHGVFTDAL
jgi:hypothetical protein